MVEFLLGAKFRIALIGIAALLIVSSVAGAFWYVRSLTDEIAETRKELATERTLRQQVQSELTLVRSRQLQQIERINTLDALNQLSQRRWEPLSREVEELKLEGPVDATVADLNRLNRAANRMLERATGADADR